MSAPTTSNSGGQRIAWVLLGVLLLVQVPMFLHQPLTPDCVLFDLEARTLLRGGVLYRDIFETNPPGTTWLHLGVRWLLGTTSEALRLFDLALLTGVAWLLSRWVRRAGASTAITIAAVAVVFGIYFSQSIWCHCQRDLWMTFFGLVALALRFRQSQQLAEAMAARVFAWGVLEGLIWGFAFWIKPFIAVPATLCLLATVRLASLRRVLLDWAAVMLGGIVAGALGIAWMVSVGAWPWFVETLLVWNPEYFASRQPLWSPGNALAILYQLRPWLLLHLPAIPLAVAQARRALRTPTTADGTPARALLPLFYLGLVLQSVFLQHWHAYVHLPGIIVAVAVLAGDPLLRQARLAVPTALAFVLAGLLLTPTFAWNRLRHWPVCWATTVAAHVRDDLRGPLDVVYPSGPDWVELEQVANFLRAREVRNGEVTCYSYSVMYLYHELGLEPSSRFICPRIYALRFFVSRQNDIHQLLEDSPQKYVVTDLVMAGLSPAEIAEANKGELPPRFVAARCESCFPWSHPVVFRAGRYLVHEIHTPMGPFGVLRLDRR